MTLSYLQIGAWSCVMFGVVTTWCRVPIARDAVVPDEPPLVEQTCRACLVELVREGVLPASCDPRRWATWLRQTRDLRRGAAREETV